MDELTNLAIKYGTDKWGKHNYTPFYHDLFGYRKNRIMKLIEIGVAEGAGLRMFRDYFTNGMIYGAEIDPNRLIKEDRIETFLCDQAKTQDLKDLIKKTGTDIDIIIDDGSHESFDQMSTCINIIQLLTSDFIYIIEDVSDNDLIKRLGKEITIGEKKFMADEIRLGARHDDRLIVVRPKK